MTPNKIPKKAEGVNSNLGETDEKVASIRELLAKIDQNEKAYNEMRLNKYNGQ